MLNNSITNYLNLLIKGKKKKKEKKEKKLKV